MNKITILGRITKDLELKHFGEKNTARVQFGMAVNRKYKNSKGEYDVDFFNCVAFGNQAETMNKLLKKGSQIILSGSMYNDKYEKDGKNIDNWKFHVDEFYFCGSNSKSTEKSDEPKLAPIADDSCPF